MRKLLIATSNIGKYKEIVSELADLEYKFVNLRSVKLHKIEAPEPFDTLEENALFKARFYAEKSGLLTFAEDTGLFVKNLHGEPGIHSKRYGSSAEERVEKLLSALKNIPKKKRSAYFETAGCLYDPKNMSWTMFGGILRGEITDEPTGKNMPGMSYDAIFYFPPYKMTLAELSTPQKNLISHRGQVLNQLKHHLQKHFQFNENIIPVGIIIKDKKILLLKRRDHREEFNNKWEFPGGKVREQEQLDECLHRECFEETGYRLNIIERLPIIPAMVMGETAYKIYLCGYICEIKSGKLKISERENNGFGWFKLKEALQSDLLPLNKKCIQSNIHVLRKYLD